ncbi:MAG: putative extracellular nuclease [Phenylobacterium sp.]|jgi:predicted extracellular nuclease
MITSKLKTISTACLALSALVITACNAAPNSARANQPAECQTAVAQSTKISAIQGESHRSSMVDQVVTVQALVSAVKPGLSGYYLLEQQRDWDGSTKSSEGIFVFDKQFKPTAGDEVVVTAKVAEFKGLTQLTKVSALTVCSQNNALVATRVTLPLVDKYQLESYEGMLITLPQTLTLSETYNLTRYGQMTLSNGRLRQPTNIAKPGVAANKIAAANKLNQIVIDDSSVVKNPLMTFAVDHPFRTGNTIKGIEGVLHFAFGNYLVESLSGLDELKFTRTNVRAAKPMLSDKGSSKGQLRVASFNVLNYFNGAGSEKTFPTKRGAHSKAEFDRQNSKIVAAMKVIDADIFGLMEIENDGYASHSAIAELTANLARATGKAYSFVRPSVNGSDVNKLGTDAIAVGMIYDADKVQLAGKAVTLSVAPFDGKNRQPLAQTFKSSQGGGEFTVVVNHFKSKRCPRDKSDANASQGDGQGCWNLNRTLAANKLVKWLNTAPTGSQDKDVLIIGDLNAYAKEDPVTALINAGYHNMVEKFQGEDAYSYVYKGLSGYLDHALASTSLASQVVDATDWHINADEMRITDYNLEHKSKAQQQRLFRMDAFRSSDHDPMIIELLLR